MQGCMTYSLYLAGLFDRFVTPSIRGITNQLQGITDLLYLPEPASHALLFEGCPEVLATSSLLSEAKQAAVPQARPRRASGQLGCTVPQARPCRASGQFGGWLVGRSVGRLVVVGLLVDWLVVCFVGCC